MKWKDKKKWVDRFIWQEKKRPYYPKIIAGILLIFILMVYCLVLLSHFF